ncbi:hypothetical protein [Haloechinothrix halophila]|uniref:hypothetical protein n=1 Tax=Haloechinothrix halophila TaxID=1069073 RepID=UPI0004007F31|nr:hypothetical protein [Haloechinothrix halophila]
MNWPETRENYRVIAQCDTATLRRLLDECLPESRTDIDTTIAANLIVSMLSSPYRWYDPHGPAGIDQLTEQITVAVRRMLGVDPAVPVPTDDTR